MTKQEFLSCIKFNRYYEFRAASEPSDNCIGHILYMGMFECNVRRITNKHIFYYTSVLGKSFSFRFDLNKLRI